MSAAPNKRLKSSWTPLSNEEANIKIFEERKVLVSKWFDKWNDSQRKSLLQDLLSKCKMKQAEFSANLLKNRVPVHRQDFSQVLPRVITLYIFSFLDPRSLCRCSQVSWYWKFLCELDQLWMPKCMKLGWYLSFVPSPYETGVWKRNYIENIRSLQYLKLQEPPPHSPTEGLERLDLGTHRSDSTTISNSHKKPPTPSRRAKKPAWKGSDPVPKDIWRYNILQNEDEVEKVNNLRKTGKYSSEALEISKRTMNKVKTGKSILIVKPKRAKSLPRLASPEEGRLQSVNGGRPDWAQHREGQPLVNKSSMGDVRNGTNAGIRPSPVHRSAFSKADHVRSQRDPPSSPLFNEKPWMQVPPDDIDSDEEYQFRASVVKHAI